MVVMKFGGSSVADRPQIEKVMEIVKTRLPRRPVVVCSAHKGMTDRLVRAAKNAVSREYELPDECPLGVYYASIIDHGGGSFRVEEYKKPEFEVSVEAPKAPVKLGDKIAATIQAKYYFGSPVTTATVKFKVLRTTHNTQWFAPAAWDWMYGEGYWWFAYDYAWWPGWEEWGCPGPRRWWWPMRHEPPELVLENEVPVGPDGTVKVEIDTALAKAVYGDRDHRYEITAEVTDQSRRTIVGSGSVIAARKPFKVHAWLDRGYHHAGDAVVAHFQAFTPDRKPVEGKGELKLLAVAYEKGKPVETVLDTWAVDTNPQGYARQQFKAARAGQYRLSYTLADAAGNKIEGGYVFVVRGEGFDGRDFRFADLELIPDRKEYAPGESVELMINTARENSTVVLFARPANGVYPLNPNGSVADIAGICNRRGNVVGLMPHPEDHIVTLQNPLGCTGRLGLAIFCAMVAAL